MTARTKAAWRRPAASEPRLRIVYEDQSLIVVDKPAGLPSVSPRHLAKPSAWSTLRRILEARVLDPHRGDPASKPTAGARDDQAPARLREQRSPLLRAGARRGRAARASRAGRGPAVELYLIHRLDQPASGLLIFARTERARAGLKEMLAARKIVRRYAAIVEGRPKEDQGELRSRLVEMEGPTHPVRSLRAGDGAEQRAKAQLAVTRYRLLGSREGRSALEVELESGRKHQIRVHLAEAGHPVAGDRLYGARGSAPLSKGPATLPRARGRSPAVSDPPARGGAAGTSSPGGGRKGHAPARPRRLLLHAWKLAFQHPVTRRKLEFVSPPGPEFEQAVPGAFRPS